MDRKKLLKRLGIATAAVAGVLLGLTLVGWVLIHRTPRWYRPLNVSPEQREVLAKSAEDKITTVQNAAAMSRIETQPPDVIQISFTDDEMNAIFNKWSVIRDVKSSYERFVTDPCVNFEDGRLIVAGESTKLDTIVSLHFEPSIDEQGQLHIKLVQILAGKLPLPQAVFSQYEQRAAIAVQQRLPSWQRRASIDSTGIANSSAISAVMGQFLINVLDNQPIQPVLFIPLVQKGSVPVELINVKITDHTLTLQVRPMNAQQRDELIGRIRDGTFLASGK